MTRRLHWPCRACGADHQNPMSSSICQPCGASEREAREAQERTAASVYAASPLGQFMAMSEDDRWQELFERLNALEQSATR
jgi:hypothetical protein